MQLKQKKVLIIGLFLSEKNKNKILRTAADQLKELLQKNGREVIYTSTKTNKYGRFIDTVLTIIGRQSEYTIGIVPLYGGAMSHFWEMISSKLLKLLGKKVVLIMHGGSIPASLQANPKKYLQSFSRADTVVCPSNYFIEVLKPFKVEGHLIENVLNLSEYQFYPRQTFRPKLFWMRTLEDIYNPEMAIRVSALLSKRYPDFELVMAGHDRGMLAGLKQMAIDYGIGEKVTFPGYISNGKKNSYAKHLDIYICTNRIDNAPVTFIEMMAMGLPIVSVNVGGIPHFIEHRQNGLLVDLDDDEAMANAVSILVDNPEQTVKMIENARRFSLRFDEKEVVKKWDALFSNLEETNK